jgi:hypothetical protein
MSDSNIILLNVKLAVRQLDRVTADLTPEQLHWNPPGTAHSVAATWAHAGLSTDWQYHSLFEGGQPLFATEWAGKTGVSEPVVVQTLEWAQTVKVDAPVFREYANVVYENLFAYIESKSEEDFNRPVDMSVIGAGERPLLWCLSAVVIGHLNQLVGEVAAVKGAQGLEGY